MNGTDRAVCEALMQLSRQMLHVSTGLEKLAKALEKQAEAERKQWRPNDWDNMWNEAKRAIGVVQE